MYYLQIQHKLDDGWHSLNIKTSDITEAVTLAQNCAKSLVSGNIRIIDEDGVYAVFGSNGSERYLRSFYVDTDG